MNNPFLKRLEAQGTNGHGKTSEKRVMKKIGARETSNSGATRGSKGDGTAKKGQHKFRLEAKSTIHESLSVQLAWLNKITHEALSHGEVPVLTMSFVTPDGKPKQRGEWVAFPLHFAEEIFDLLEEDGAGSLRPKG